MSEQWPLPDASFHRPGDTDYLRELLANALLTQRGAARLLGIEERTMRNYCAGKSVAPYPVQYALEMLVAARVVMIPTAVEVQGV